VKKIWRVEKEFSLTISARARRQRFSSWNDALQRTLL